MRTMSDSSTKGPRVSVVVSTYQRASFLPRLVAALEEQTLPGDAFEVVMVDNGSTDGTAALLSDLSARTRLDLRMVKVPVNRGPAPGRNAGWRAARAPIIAFTDDDCVPTSGWLAEGLHAMGGGQRAVVGRTVPHPDQHAQQGPFSLTVAVEDTTYFHTCNVFYRREHLEEVGGFDETFSTPGGEDTDLGLRVCALGTEAVFSPEALMYHEVHRSSFRSALRQATRWGDIVYLFRKHPAARHLLLRKVFWRESHARALVAAAGLATAGAGVAFHPAFLAGVVGVWPYIDFRLHHHPLTPGPRRRWAVMPLALAIDLVELVTMVRASIRHRVLVL